MPESITGGKILDIKIKNKYLIILSNELHSFIDKNHFIVEVSQAIGYRMNGEHITFYFKDFPILKLEINKDIINKTSEVLKIVFPTIDNKDDLLF
jgi:hypothetical protein